MSDMRKWWRQWLTLGVLAMLTGCSGTRVLSTAEPALQRNPQLPSSTVYILREESNFYLGPANGPVRIEINGHDVAAINEGDYIMLKVKPGESLVVTKNMSKFGAELHPREMTATATFNFGAGQTNFIRLKVYNGEFRGVYFTPERIEFNRARELVKRLRAVNTPANQRIDRL